MADFPSYASVLVDRYDETPSYGVLRTPMDGGLAKQRPVRTLPVVTRNVMIHVGDITSRRLFDQWFRNDINGGTGWFNWTDPLDGVVKSSRIVNGALTWTPNGISWSGKAQIETVG